MMKRLVLIAVAISLSACSLPTRAPVTPSSWTVAPERVAAPRQARTPFWLKIGAVSVAPPFDGKSLVYRLGDQRYEKDFYNVYSSIPGEMIGNAERQWLNNANIFSAAVGQNNSFFPYYILQASVNEFYGDYRVKPEAVVSVEFFLTVVNAGKTNPLIGANRYTKRVALKDNTPEALVIGQQQALAEILKQYEDQLDKYAANLPKPMGY
ncbi:membrane integrity-associated transporter subunit PqiC [Polynucleobacter sp. UK-Kesae-W10]|uniref:PqiC family protein n=1 Tax=Polynucleobacter sp. UK-Kesae-W10 TaxID=1819738 RepID=UPI001C0BAD30|nr:ABC-type transport auxiliary lipoprotein family protein [Polynucleobacter sp. UK-Kesae-W10]MBU3578076.1 membrane integrity-associated transporter subunit PqiC [Polynucleobacter sp. UK-Kesae-W10]